ncbi:MAG: DUF6531 domain-containing protein, partial [Chloroflexota bacterium]|nr:DUF6531 domain-containing protein [Chloroflexota bacterium]
MASGPSLSTDLPLGTTVEFDGQTYGPGDIYPYAGDACKVVAFINSAVTQIGAQHPGRNWGANADIVEGWTTLCGVQQTLDELDDTLSASHDPPIAQPEATGLDGQPPGDEETAGSLGAPSPPVAVEAGPRDSATPDPTQPDPRTPAEQLRDPAAPASEGQIADALTNAGLPLSAIPDLLEQARRGDPPPGEPHPFRSDPEESQQVTAADPVNLFSGEYTLEAVDFDIPARGFPFQLVRVYASGRPYFGPWGFNWDHNYNVYLRELLDGRVAIWTGQLREDIYVPKPEGGFEPPIGLYADLTAERDPSGSLAGYALAYRGGIRWVFQHPAGWPQPERIPLVRIEDPHGNAQQLLYDAQGRLARVVDTVGREIRFHYGQCGLLEAVTDFAGRTIEYHHAPHVEHLVRVISPPTPDALGGLATDYEYDDFQAHPALQHNIVRVSDPAGRTVVENEYGRDPSGDDFNRVVRQYALGDEYHYRYTRLRYVPPLAEALNDAYLRAEFLAPCTPLRVYTFNFRGGLLDERYRLVRDGSYRLWVTSYRYNRQGELSELRRSNGLCVRFAYAEAAPDPRDRGNLLRVTLSPPPTSLLVDRVLWEATYEPRFQHLKTVTDEAGETTTYVYDYEETPAGQRAGNLARIEYPTVTLPDGRKQKSEERFRYNAFGQVIEWLSGEGHRVTYDYYAAGPATGYLRRTVDGAGIEDESREFDYDQYGNLRAVTDAAGGVTEYAYNALGQLLRLRRPAVAGARGEIRYRYGRDGLMASQEMPRGAYQDSIIADPYLRHTYELDALAHTRSETYGANTAQPRTTRVKSTPDGLPLEVEDPLGRMTRLWYDERNLVLRRTLFAGTPEERVLRSHYDRNGNLTRLSDPAGPDLLYRYDAWDRLREVELAGGGTRVRYHYGVRDQLERLEMIAPPGPAAAPVVLAEVEHEYDERGRLVRRREGARSVVHWYDRDSCLVREQDQRGNAVAYTCDALGRATSTTDALGNTVAATFDARGNLVGVDEAETAPGLAVPETYHTDLRYDARNRLTHITDPAGNTFVAEYDDRDLPVAITTPSGTRHEYARDLDGAVILARVLAGNQTPPLEHRWQRDRGGRVRAYVDPEGRRTEYGYNLADWWTGILLPDGSLHRRIFNPAGQLVREAAPSGAAAEYRYDADGTVAHIRYLTVPGVLGLPDLVYARDGLGRPVQLAQGGVTLDLQYDAAGRVVSEAMGGTSARWSYDDAAGTADLTYPDGRVDRYQLDALGRIEAVTLHRRAVASLTGVAEGAELARYRYVGPQRLQGRMLGNGTATRYHYDRGRRLAGIEHREPGGGLLARADYVYDADGRRRVLRAEPTPGASALYTYDPSSRLVRAADGIAAPAPPTNADQAQADAYLQALGSPAAQRTYDFTVNRADARTRRVVSGPGGVTSDDYTLNSLHQIVQLARTSPPATVVSPFAYDPDGRRQRDDRHGYSYDVLGRLREVRDGAGNILLQQEFDPLGRVMLRDAGSGTPARLRYLGARRLQEETPTGVPMRQRCSGLQVDELVVQSATDDHWGHQDGRLSLLALSDSTGAATERYGYTPFGIPSIWAADGVTPLAISAVGVGPVFGGHHALGPAGLYDARARVYDADTGCFLQRDPRGYSGSASLYAYTSHNPVDYIDPTGEIPHLIAAAVIIGALAGAGYSAYDASEHPERYQGGFSWRTLFQTFGGAAIGGVSGAAAVAAGGVATSLVGGGAAAGAGTATGGGLGLLKTAFVAGTASAASGTVWSAGFHEMFPEIVDPPSLSGAASDFAMGGVFSFARPVFKAIIPKSVWNSAATGIQEYAQGVNLARQGPWRIFGARGPFNWQLWRPGRNPRLRYAFRNIFYNDRPYEAVSRQYWRGQANGNSLQHLWAMNSTRWVPQGLRNAGLNLLETPGALNSWMTNMPSRNYAFRATVSAILAGTGYGTYKITEFLTGESGVAANPVGGNGVPQDSADPFLSTSGDLATDA